MLYHYRKRVGLPPMVFRGRLLLFFALAGAPILLTSAAPAAADAAPAAIVARYAGNVPPNVRAAVDMAMTIWAQRIETTVPIEVDVVWGGGLPSGVAAATEPLSYHQTQSGGVLQAVALANAIAGFDHDAANADIRLLLGSGIRWYTGLD